MKNSLKNLSSKHLCIIYIIIIEKLSNELDILSCKAIKKTHMIPYTLKEVE